MGAEEDILINLNGWLQFLGCLVLYIIRKSQYIILTLSITSITSPNLNLRANPETPTLPKAGLVHLSQSSPCR